MLSILILITAYRYYATLAHDNYKTKWHYGLLAIGVYLGTQILVGAAYGIYLNLNGIDVEQRNWNSFSGINLLSWAVSIVAVLIVYKWLERKFKKESIAKNSKLEIDEIGRKEQQ